MDSEIGIQEAELWVPYIEIMNVAYNIGLTTRPGRLFNKETTVSFQELRPLKKLIREYDSRVFRTMDFKQAKAILQQAKKILNQIKRMQEERKLKTE